MNSVQYEELCRFFLADKLGISIEEIQSATVPSPVLPDLPKYSHQIDLYWEGGDELTRYVNIANAKWRSSDKVDQPDVLLLQQVKEDLDANKAMMITNIGFTEGAKAVAKNKGIALHIVCPNFDQTILPLNNRGTIQTQLREFSTANKPPYDYEIIHRAFELETVTVVQTSTPIKEVVSSNRMRQSPSNRRGPSYTQKAPRGQGQPQQRFTRNTGGRANRRR